MSTTAAGPAAAGTERWLVAPAMVAAPGWLVAVIEKVPPAGLLPLR